MPVLVADPKVSCFTGAHVYYSLFAIYMVCVFLTSAVACFHVSPCSFCHFVVQIYLFVPVSLIGSLAIMKLANLNEVLRFEPSFLIWERVVKFAALVLVTIFTPYVGVHLTLITMLVACLFLAGYIILRPPCKSRSFALFRVAFLLCAGWTNVASMVALRVDDTTNWTAAIVLFVGWPLIAAGILFVSAFLRADDPTLGDREFWVDTEWTQTFKPPYVLVACSFFRPVSTPLNYARCVLCSVLCSVVGKAASARQYRLEGDVSSDIGGTIRRADDSAVKSADAERKPNTDGSGGELRQRKGNKKDASDASQGEFKDVGRWEIDSKTKQLWLHMDGTHVVLHLRSNRRKAEAIAADGSLSLFNFVRREPRAARDLFQLKLTQEITSRSSIQQTSQFFEGSQWRWFADAGGKSACKALLDFQPRGVLRIDWMDKNDLKAKVDERKDPAQKDNANKVNALLALRFLMLR